MGCWNETCAITQLPISSGDPVVMFILTKVPPNEKNSSGYCESTDVWTPRFIQIYGDYDDYGRLEGYDEDHWNMKFIIDNLKNDAIPMEQGDNKYHDLAVEPENFDFKLIQTLIDKNRLSVPIDHGMVSIAGVNDTPIGFMFVHRFVFDTMVNFKLDTFRGIIDLESIISSGIAWCKHYKDRDDGDGLSREILKSGFLHNNPDVGEFNNIVNFGNIYVRRNCIFRYIVRLFDMAVEEETTNKELIDFVVELSKFHMFSVAMQNTRKSFSPQNGKGSQSSEYDLYKEILNASLEHIKEEERKYD